MSRVQKVQTVSLFDESDFAEIKRDISKPVLNAKKKLLMNSEPNIDEIREVYKHILTFISKRELVIYGGTALDAAFKSIGQTGFYDEWNLGDIDFYSSSLNDIIDLANYLYDKQFKDVTVGEAVHDETYALRVNGNLYCEFSYVPKRILHYIPRLNVKHKIMDWSGKLLVVHPHYAFIDMLRMFTDMTAAFRWEKQYDRLNQMNTYFPLPDYSIQIIPKLEPESDVKKIMDEIYHNFANKDDVKPYLILNGIMAYNFYVATSRKEMNNDEIKDVTLTVPFLDFICQSEDTTNETHIRIGNELLEFVKSIAPKKELVNIEEFNPFFQLYKKSYVIYYNRRPIIQVVDGSNQCIPSNKLKSGKIIGCYQSTLLSLMIFRFRAEVDKSEDNNYSTDLEKIYGWASSNLIKMANLYRHHFNKGPLDDSLFEELVTTCDGKFITPDRLAAKKRSNRKKAGKRPRFEYKPSDFFQMAEEDREKFKPENFIFKNTAGTRITNEKFKVIGRSRSDSNDDDSQD